MNVKMITVKYLAQFSVIKPIVSRCNLVEGAVCMSSGSATSTRVLFFGGRLVSSLIWNMI